MAEEESAEAGGVAKEAPSGFSVGDYLTSFLIPGGPAAVAASETWRIAPQEMKDKLTGGTVDRDMGKVVVTTRATPSGTEIVPPGLAGVEVLPSPADVLPQETAPAAAGGGGSGTPGGMQPFKHKWSQEGQVPIHPEVRRAYETGYGYQARGLAGEEAAKRGAAVADALGAQAKYESDQLAQGQLTRLRQQRDAVVGEKRQLIEDLTNDIADDKVQHDRYWADASVGKKIRLGIGALLSGIAAGLAGQPLVNRTLDMIEKRNEQDAREQLRQIQEKKGRREEVRNSIDGLMKLFGSEEEAVLANKALQYSALSAEVEKHKLGAKSALARAQFDSLLGGLALKRAETLQKLNELSAGKVSESFEDKYARPTGGGGGGAPAGKGPDMGRLSALSKEYGTMGLADSETALKLLGEAVGMDGGHFAAIAQQDPGYITQMLATASVKDPAKLQKAAAAWKMSTHKYTGAATTPSEKADVLRGFNTATPRALATTAAIIARQYQTGESVLWGGYRDVYPHFASYRREYLTRMRPSVGAPGAGRVPERAPREKR